MAQSNRILSLGKGLIANNAEVEVIVTRPTEKKDSQINFQYMGTHEGLKFRYASKNMIWPDSKFQKLLVYSKDLIKTMFYLLKNRNNFDFCIISNPRILIDPFFKLAFFKKSFLITVDEYPVFERYNKFNSFIRGSLKNHGYKIYDGFIVMTKILIEYYSHLAKKSATFIHIPMTVDLNRFNEENIVSPNIPKDNYIAYCGNLGHHGKDGVDILIKAFKIAISKKNDFKLLLIGGTSPSQKHEIEKLKRLVKSLELEKDVIFTGKINRNLIPSYLKYSKILVLARPTSKQAEGGFPTKLGEYLATGKPVIVTKVGEIPDYLKDGVNAFLAEPDSVKSFANKLTEVFENYTHAIKIGIEGRKTAIKFFDYRTQGKALHSFLIRLKNKYIK